MLTPASLRLERSSERRDEASLERLGADALSGRRTAVARVDVHSSRYA
jgi:hypothetical protein